jgi:hypothetical protein
MKTFPSLAALLAASFSLFACAAPGEELDDTEEDAVAEPDGETLGTSEAALVGAGTCTVSVNGVLFQAAAKLEEGGVSVRLDGATGSRKNAASIIVNYANGGLVNVGRGALAAKEWNALPVVLDWGTRYTVYATFALPDSPRCEIQLQT